MVARFKSETGLNTCYRHRSVAYSSSASFSAQALHKLVQ